METQVHFQNEGCRLHGVLHAPEAAVDRRIALVFLHGWSGSRLGPHRMFVTAARRFEAAGFTSLRFDFRGRGASEGATAQTTISGMISDARAACAYVREAHGLTRLILIGICSGCKVAIGAASTGAESEALGLWSAEPMGRLRTRASQTHRRAAALQTYARKLLRLSTWRKILTRRVNVRAVSAAVTVRERAGEDELAAEDGLLHRFRAYRGRILFVYGTLDPETRDAAPGYAEFCRSAGIPHELHAIPGPPLPPRPGSCT